MAFKPGDVLVDTMTLENGLSLLCREFRPLINIDYAWASLVQLIEALVLYNTLIASENTLNALAPELTPSRWEIGHIVRGVKFKVDVQPPPITETAYNLPYTKALAALAKPDVYKEFERLIDPPIEWRNSEDFDDWLKKGGFEALSEAAKQFELGIELAIVRGFIYYGVAMDEGASYLPHPLRAKVISHYFKYLYKSPYQSAAQKVLSEIQKQARDEIAEINQWIGNMRFRLEVPLVFNYIMSRKPSSSKDLIQISLEVREAKEAVEFRKRLAEFDLAARIGDDKSVYEIKNELEDCANRLRKKSTDDPFFELEIAFPPAIAFRPGSFYQRFQIKRKRHLIFMQHLYNAALQSRGKWEYPLG